MAKCGVLVAVAVLAAASARASAPAPTTYAALGRQALATLLDVYYHGDGFWKECDAGDCPASNTDWGVDSLTYALALRWQTAHDSSIPPVMSALSGVAPRYPGPCTGSSCGSWSDVPEWDAIAAVREYQVTGDADALARAEAAFAFVEGSDVYALGACPDIRYQQPFGQANHLKTLETDANAVKAAILLREATGDARYLQSAITHYATIRAHFLDPALPLYSVYVFDDGSTCTQVPHRFFASVNGDMIWSGVELARDTGDRAYLEQAIGTGRAVDQKLGDARGIF